MQTINESYYDILLERAKLHPERLAIVKNSDRLTYKNLIDRIDRIASYLISLGVKKGDKVVIWSTAHPMWLCAYYGIVRAKGVAVILNANYTIHDAKGLVEFSDAKYILYSETHDTKAMVDSSEILSEAFGIPSDNIINYMMIDYDGIDVVEIDSSDCNVTDDAYMIFTSGTTGFPKAVVTSQFGIVNVTRQLANEIQSIKSDKVCMSVPLFHAYGLMVSFIYLQTGGTIYIPCRVKVDIIADLVEKERIADIWSVAAIYQGIIDNKDIAARLAPIVRMCTIAGAYTSPVQFKRYETVLHNATFINMYGMTETCAAYCLTRAEDSIDVRYNTVGRQIQGVEMATWDEKKGILPKGVIGEVVTRGYHLKNQYYKLPDEKQAVDKDGWLHSGDLGVIDNNGNLRIVGRIKDIIIKGGENLAPAEIESEVMEMPGIKECRIFGYHDRIYGENLAACVTLKDGEIFDEVTVKKKLKKKIGSYKTPTMFFTYGCFPLNANGKVDQRKLHVDMLDNIRRLELTDMLKSGVCIASLTVKDASFSITPAVNFIRIYAQGLMYSDEHVDEMALYASNVLANQIIGISEDVGDITISINCMSDSVCILFQDALMPVKVEYPYEDGFDPVEFIISNERLKSKALI